VRHGLYSTGYNRRENIMPLGTDFRTLYFFGTTRCVLLSAPSAPLKPKPAGSSAHAHPHNLEECRKVPWQLRLSMRPVKATLLCSMLAPHACNSAAHARLPLPQEGELGMFGTRYVSCLAGRARDFAGLSLQYARRAATCVVFGAYGCPLTACRVPALSATSPPCTLTSWQPGAGGRA